MTQVTYQAGRTTSAKLRNILELLTPDEFDSLHRYFAKCADTMDSIKAAKARKDLLP